MASQVLEGQRKHSWGSILEIQDSRVGSTMNRELAANQHKGSARTLSHRRTEAGEGSALLGQLDMKIPWNNTVSFCQVETWLVTSTCEAAFALSPPEAPPFPVSDCRHCCTVFKSWTLQAGKVRLIHSLRKICFLYVQNNWSETHTFLIFYVISRGFSSNFNFFKTHF